MYFFFSPGDAVSADARIIHKAGVVGLCVTKDRLFSVGIDGMRNTVDVGAGVCTLYFFPMYERHNHI